MLLILQLGAKYWFIHWVLVSESNVSVCRQSLQGYVSKLILESQDLFRKLSWVRSILSDLEITQYDGKYVQKQKNTSSVLSWFRKSYLLWDFYTRIDKFVDRNWSQWTHLSIQTPPETRFGYNQIVHVLVILVPKQQNVRFTSKLAREIGHPQLCLEHVPASSAGLKVCVCVYNLLRLLAVIIVSLHFFLV